jgi:hypothetical protein
MPLARSLLPSLLCFAFASSAAELPPQEELRGWIEEFKTAPRGPFENIRWFCADGSVLAPEPYACAERGGGVQHGALNERARALRAGGYEVATVLAGIDSKRFTGPGADLRALEQLLVERFLIQWDEGWIFRAARSYRGALQSEDEEAGARELVLALLADPAWRSPERFTLLREAVRLLPLHGDAESAARVRAEALALAERDPGFAPLRVKIHNAPDSGDARRIREYAPRGRPELAPRYEGLAAGIEVLFARGAAGASCVALADRLGEGELAEKLREKGAQLEAEERPAARLAYASRLLADLRGAFADVSDPEEALALLDTSLALELEVFARGADIPELLPLIPRRQRLWLLLYGSDALYGSGLIGLREVASVKRAIVRLERSGAPRLDTWRRELRYLSRVPEWADRWLGFVLGRAVERLAPLEPEARLYPQDRLRGSPMLLYGNLVDALVLDANRLAGVEHELFGERVGAGLRALNPGLARGTLRTEQPLDPDGIHLLPQTTAELTPVAGILTRGEGSSLSHVQLLARNLGIPNVVVGEPLLPAVTGRLGSRAVLAVSPGGVVRLAADSPEWDAVFGDEPGPAADVKIVPDVEKLDLAVVAPVRLESLRAADSGRISGPKGANLGELRAAFGDAVPPGFVIPFGSFRALLEQPFEPGGPSAFEWMRRSYAEIAEASDRDPDRDRRTSEFLRRLRDWILATDPGPEFDAALRAALRESFGEDGSYGVFLRSDTNVEDLPGFTGAGLNLTVPNVVSEDEIVRAVRQVWASPFSDRSWQWRQAHMDQPEYVFPAVVVQLAFPAEKSGVMVTADVEDGLPGWISVAASEGVGGAVEGQATESLRIGTRTGQVRFLARATALERSELDPAGGIVHVPASGAGHVLGDDEIPQLIELAAEVRKRFPQIEGAADIEFAFRDGRLALLQIRPFVESGRAQSSAFLLGLDAAAAERGATPVDLDAVPGEE